MFTSILIAFWYSIFFQKFERTRNLSLYDSLYRTDKMAEAAILEVVKANFKDHLILGEEGGIIGDASSDYLWCIDPLGRFSLFLVSLDVHVLLHFLCQLLHPWSINSLSVNRC